MVLNLLHHRPLTSLGKWCLIRSLCHTPGTVLDCGAQVNILEGALGSGTRIQLTGITGDKTKDEMADAVFPVIAADGSRHAISIRGKNIVATRATDNILLSRCCFQQAIKSIFAWALLKTQLMAVISTPRGLWLAYPLRCRGY